MGTFRNEFSWSHSRGETFRECLRRYYYQYYGHWGGWERGADPAVRKLYMLRNLKNRYLWAGSVVHDSVADLLGKVRAGLVVPSPEDAAEAAVARMRTEFRQSRDGAYLTRPKKALGLSEHHYREPVDDSEWRSFADMARRSIIGFAQGPFLQSARELPPADWLTLEELLTFQISDAKVYVKMDFAYRRASGGAVICDWKTGKRRPQPEGLQLGCYALYATEHWGVKAEEIQVIEANINTGATGTAQLSLEHIEEARREIGKSIEKMRGLLRDPQENAAREEDFPPKPAERNCRRCVFREVCDAYAEMTGGVPETMASKK